jgi:ribokinase
MTERTPSVARPAVAVVGSTNLDLVVPVDRIPRPGETVVGGDLFRAPGGKGANQAVACARLGAPTSFVGCVGDDEAGRTLRAALREDGVVIDHLQVADGVASGTAMIVVDPAGENAITVSPGANAHLSPGHLVGVGLDQVAALLLQLEIPLPTVVAAAEATTGLVVLNPAPARPLPDDLLGRTDVLVPNRGELAVLCGRRDEPDELDEVVDLARSLPAPSRIVVTLGAQGAVAIDDGEVSIARAFAVEAVDATGAGDTFCAALAVALTEGAALADATRWAVVAAGLAVTRRGAQPSIPTRVEVDAAARRPPYAPDRRSRP